MVPMVVVELQPGGFRSRSCWRPGGNMGFRRRGRKQQPGAGDLDLVGWDVEKKLPEYHVFKSFFGWPWDLDVSLMFLGTLGTLIQDQLHHVTLVASTDAAFAALRSDGVAICWGFSLFGGGTPLPGAAWKHRGVVAGETWWNLKLVMLEYGSSLYEYWPVLNIIVPRWQDCCSSSSTEVVDIAGRAIDLVGTGCAFSALKDDGTVSLLGPDAGKVVVKKMPWTHLGLNISTRKRNLRI